MRFNTLKKISINVSICGLFIAPNVALAQDKILNQTVTDSSIHTEEGCNALAKEYGQTAFVRVQNIRSDEGNIRVEVYANKEDEFLKGDLRLNRIDVPSVAVERNVCLILPGTEKYALVVIHDRNANDKADFFTEGFGFSNNIQLKLSKPKLEEVAFQAKEGMNNLELSLAYMFVSDNQKEKKRRKFRRR